MEPKNKGLEDDFPFQTGDFQVPCLTSGVYLSSVRSLCPMFLRWKLQEKNNIRNHHSLIGFWVLLFNCTPWKINGTNHPWKARKMIWTKPPGNYVPAVNLQGCIMFGLPWSFSTFFAFRKAARLHSHHRRYVKTVGPVAQPKWINE